jgi:hypothetical protein
MTGLANPEQQSEIHLSSGGPSWVDLHLFNPERFAQDA